MLATITALSLVISFFAPSTALIEQPLTERDLAQDRPRTLVVEFEQADPDHVTLDARFHLESGAHGVLRVDSWTGESPSVESEFSVDGVPHVWLRQVEGEAPEMWFSPDIEADPALMLRYWGVITDLRLYESTEKNPACRATRWGLKALTWIAGVACCRLAGGVACGVCTVGLGTAHERINAIDCNKECKPECPIP